MKSRFIAYLSGLALILSSATASAVETGLSIYPKGMSGFMSGIVPPSGFYFLDTYYHFNGNVESRVRNGQAEFGVSMHMDADFLEGTYVSDAKFLGGTYAAVGAIAVATAGVHASTTSAIGVLDIHASNDGLADSIVTPVLLGWHDGNFHWNTGLSIYVPTGGYSTSELSLGRNVWGLMPEFALTWFDPASGWDASGTFIYVTMSRNDATDYQSGDLMHLDWSVGKHLGPAWELGIAGNIVQQVGADSGSGAKLGSFKAESFGIGPALSYSTKAGNTPMIFAAKWEHDINAHATFGGDIMTVSATVVF